MNTFQQFQKELTKHLLSTKERFTELNNENTVKVNFEEEYNFFYHLVTSSFHNVNGIASCTFASLKEAFLNIAKHGLSINPKLNLCFVRTEPSCAQVNVNIAVYDFGYKGLLKLITRTGKVKIVTADVFYENDNFEFRGTREAVIHSTRTLSSVARGTMAGGYCSSELVAGGVVTTVMTPEEISQIETVCRSTGNEAWNSVFIDELRRKTLIKRHWKTLMQVIEEQKQTASTEEQKQTALIEESYQSEFENGGY